MYKAVSVPRGGSEGDEGVKERGRDISDGDSAARSFVKVSKTAVAWASFLRARYLLRVGRMKSRICFAAMSAR